VALFGVVQLNEYMVELSGSFLPEHLHDYLCTFVEMAQYTAAAKKGGANAAAVGGAAPQAAASGPPPGGGSDDEDPLAGSGSGGGGGGGAAAEEPTAASSSAAAAKKADWDDSFMNMDPMAGLLEPTPAPAAPAAPTAEKPKPKPSPSPLAVPPVAPLPAFAFGGGSVKSYAASGEGLRDAIKDKNVAGVKQVLAQAPKLTCNYQDRLSQTMLHLAAIFDHTVRRQLEWAVRTERRAD
jgi:hypothetical protein